MMPVRLLLVVAVAWRGAGAQQVDRSSDTAAQFVADARAATERFKDVNVAIAENYVKIGPDFPAMGEHWAKGELIMKGEMDPARPAILTYATIDGKLTLTGVVYALALRQGELPPAFPGSAQWHDHVGTIDEESLLFGHDREGANDDIRLVVMHAWIWVANPAGMFATDNWALPFARLGVATPQRISPQASRAASLLSGAATYYARLFSSVGELDDREAASVADILERHRGIVQRWWAARTSTGSPSVAELAQLQALWLRLEDDVRQAVRPGSARRLRRVLEH
jgi:hypothetical protein